MQKEKSRTGINGYFCIKKILIMGMAFSQTFVRRNDISTAQGKK